MPRVIRSAEAITVITAQDHMTTVKMKGMTIVSTAKVRDTAAIISHGITR